MQKIKHHVLQTYWPVALSTVYESLVPPIMWFTYQLSGVGSICSYKWDLSVFSPSIYATLWNSCSVPHTSGLRKFPVQPCNWRVVPFKHFGYLKRHFFYFISMLCHVLANITGNRTFINIFLTSLKEHSAETIPTVLPRSSAIKHAIPRQVFCEVLVMHASIIRSQNRK